MAEEVIQGMDDLLADLGKLTFVEGEQILAKTLKNPSRLLAEEQEHLSPYDRGKLRANIGVRITERSATEAVARVGPTRKVFYAMFQNFGTKYVQADHFVEKAWSNKNAEVYAIIRYDLGRFIDKAMKKHG